MILLSSLLAVVSAGCPAQAWVCVADVLQVLRTVWLLQRWVQRQRRSRRAIMAVAAATAAPAVSPAASPVAEAGTGATATDA
jgi:hypothetical protein